MLDEHDTTPSSREDGLKMIKMLFSRRTVQDRGDRQGPSGTTTGRWFNYCFTPAPGNTIVPEMQTLPFRMPSGQTIAHHRENQSAK